MSSTKMGRRHQLAWFALAVFLVFSLGAPACAAPAAYGGTLSVGVDQEPVGMDPNLVTAFSSFWRVELLYNRLVRYDSQGRIEPDLAERWETLNPTTYVFHLRRGVKFHNGRELTAEDVKYTIERILDPKTGSPARSYLTPIKKVVVRDRYTVEIDLSEPLASLLDALTSANASIVPKEEVQRHTNLQRTAVGTGPFKLAEWVPDNYMRLVRNPDYFRKGLPYLDEVVFRVIPEQASLLAGLRSGSLDMVALSQGPLIQAAKADPNIRVVQGATLNTRTFGYNVTRPPFDNVKVRQAISLALDVRQMIDTAEFGLAYPSGPVPSSSKAWAVPPESLPFYRPDIARAKELLREAGYPEGFSMKIVTSPTFEGGLSVAQVIQQQLRQIGIKAELDVVEWGIYVNRWVKRDFDSMVELRGGGADPDRFLYRMLHSEGAVNNFMFKDAQLDRLLEKGRVTLDPQQRKAIYVQVQERIAELAPVRFLYNPVETRLMRGNVQGFELTPTGSYQYLEQTWLAK